jgi:hypothetical protein
VTGTTCQRLRRPTCATELLSRALRYDLGADETRDALVALVATRQQEFDFAGARRWAAELRRRVPEYKSAELGELDSGMAEAVAQYQEGWLPDATRGFSAIAARRDTPDERASPRVLLRRARAVRDAPDRRGVRWADAYRARYGDDPASIELRYREGDAQRITNRRAAHAVFADLVANHPDTYWAKLAATQLEAK